MSGTRERARHERCASCGTCAVPAEGWVCADGKWCCGTCQLDPDAEDLGKDHDDSPYFGTR